MLHGNNNGSFCPNRLWELNKVINMKYQHVGQRLTQRAHCVWSLLSSNCMHMNSVTGKLAESSLYLETPFLKCLKRCLKLLWGLNYNSLHLSHVTFLLWAWVSSFVLSKLLRLRWSPEYPHCTWPVPRYDLKCKLLQGRDCLILIFTCPGPTCFSGVPS